MDKIRKSSEVWLHPIHPLPIGFKSLVLGAGSKSFAKEHIVQ